MRVTIQDTVQPDRHSASVEIDSDDLNAREVLLLVRRTMLASGYAGESIDKYLPTKPLATPETFE